MKVQQIEKAFLWLGYDDKKVWHAQRATSLTPLLHEECASSNLCHFFILQKYIYLDEKESRHKEKERKAEHNFHKTN